MVVNQNIGCPACRQPIEIENVNQSLQPAVQPEKNINKLFKSFKSFLKQLYSLAKKVITTLYNIYDQFMEGLIRCFSLEEILRFMAGVGVFVYVVGMIGVFITALMYEKS